MSNARPAIDLTRHHFMREWKDLVVFGTWLHNSDQEDDEPALVVVPRYRRGGFMPVVIALSAAYRYDDPKHLAKASRLFCKSLDFEDSMANCHKIAEAIHSHLRDLLAMPDSPTSAIIVGEGRIGDGAERRTIQILDHVPLPQA